MRSLVSRRSCRISILHKSRCVEHCNHEEVNLVLEKETGRLESTRFPTTDLDLLLLLLLLPAPVLRQQQARVCVVSVVVVVFLLLQQSLLLLQPDRVECPCGWSKPDEKN